MPMKFYLIALLALPLLTSCNGVNKDSDVAFLGGQIINPNNDYITLNSPHSEKDTIFLDEDDRFSYNIKNLHPGLYTFTHGGEMQTILLEKNDSLLFRLNTNDFDESLVYTGKGSKKNNFLIKSFLNDEIEDKKFKKNHQLEPELFKSKIGAIKDKKLENLDRFISENETSELFRNIAKSSIDYNYYAYLEMYPFGYFGNNKLIHVKDLPEDFYNYRKDVDFNNVNLSGVYSYNNFMNWYFHNSGLKKYYHNGNHHTFDRQALDYNLEKLRLIDSTIENETIKNYVLKHATRVFVFNSNSAEQSRSMLASYLEKTTSEEDKLYLENLVSSTIKLYPGNLIPNIKVVDFNNNTKNLRTIIQKPTVVYCWSSNFKMHYRNSHYMMRSLKARYPEVDFIAININDMDTSSWKKTLSLLKYPTQNEYIFKNPNEAVQTFAIAYSHKVILTDENGIIINSNANLFSDEIANEIESLVADSSQSKIAFSK